MQTPQSDVSSLGDALIGIDECTVKALTARFAMEYFLPERNIVGLVEYWPAQNGSVQEKFNVNVAWNVNKYVFDEREKNSQKLLSDS